MRISDWSSDVCSSDLVGEDGVDIFQFPVMDMGLHLAFGGEGQRLGEVLAAADDGAAQGDALEYDIEDRRGEVTGRQADQTDRAFAPHDRKCTRLNSSH